MTGFALHSDNADPSGVTDDADTIWVLNRSFSNAGDKIFAYKRSDGSRDTDQDFNTLNGAGNNTPTGLCSGRDHDVGRGLHRRQALCLQDVA